MRQLSKSKLIAYRQCPKRLWLEVHRNDLRDDSGSQAAFAMGHAVGEIAQRVFDPEGKGVNVDPNLVGWEESYTRTENELRKGERPVFEAALQMPGALALADVMRPDPEYDDLHWEMIEVKSSASVKDYQRDDIAIQNYIAEQNQIPLSKVGIAHIDTGFVYSGDEDYRGLLKVEDLTEEARRRRDEVREWIEAAQKIAALDAPPEIEVGEQCKTPFTCAFCTHCHKDIVEANYPFAMLPYLTNGQRAAIQDQSIKGLKDIPADWLTHKQARVQAAHVTGELFFDQETAQTSLIENQGPTYFLDFETLMFAVPRWIGSRPFQNLPFQYSLHRVDEDGSLHHMEFLNLDGGDPRRTLTEKMIEDCGDHGVIYAYNSGFERAVIDQLATLYPDLKPSLDAIIARLDDLLPIARQCYYHPSQNGSWSLKAVAPAIAPELSYQDLEGVQVGSDAGVAFLEACSPETTPERREKLRQQLLEYCKLDTLATVRIWEVFKGDRA